MPLLEEELTKGLFMNCLQSSVVAVCSCEKQGDENNITKLYGTAFFIDNKGTFLTAKHVLEGIDNDQPSKRGLCVKGHNPGNLNNLFASIIEYEFAPQGLDIAIGQVAGYESTREFFWSDVELSVWKDIATYGYPEDAQENLSIPFIRNAVFMPIRAHKGYIQRIIEPNELERKGKGYRLELNFPISKGLSGSPLFWNRDNKNLLLGICTGSFESETANSENKPRITEYGIAQSMSMNNLENWKPNLLKGLTLKEAMTAPINH